MRLVHFNKNDCADDNAAPNRGGGSVDASITGLGLGLAACGGSSAAEEERRKCGHGNESKLLVPRLADPKLTSHREAFHDAGATFKA
jgi:hypothetical protein